MSKNIVSVKVDGKEISLKVQKVTSDVALESSECYAKAFSNALTRGMPLFEELRKIYETRGLLNSLQDDQKSKEIRKEIKELEIQLRKGIVDNRRMTVDEGRAIALTIGKKRIEASQIGSRNTELFSNSAESYADNERSKFLIYASTVYADNGERYWKSFESFVNENNKELVENVVKTFVAVSSGTDRNYEQTLYENQWLRKMGFMNEKMQLIRKDGKLVDDEGRLVDENGRFINEAGEFIDIYGNLVDKEGNLLVEDTWGVNANPEKASEPKSLVNSQ
jgi:hypothetical protein